MGKDPTKKDGPVRDRPKLRSAQGWRVRRSGPRGSMALPALAIIAPLSLTVTTPPRLLFLEPFLLRRLHVRHVLTVLPENATPVHLPSEAFECTINGLVVSNLYTYSQRGSLLRESGFRSTMGEYADWMSTGRTQLSGGRHVSSTGVPVGRPSTPHRL